MDGDAQFYKGIIFAAVLIVLIGGGYIYNIYKDRTKPAYVTTASIYTSSNSSGAPPPADVTPPQPKPEPTPSPVTGYHSGIPEIQTPGQAESGSKCTDVTSYDYDWYDDVLCTRSDGSQFYTNYAGGQAADSTFER